MNQEGCEVASRKLLRIGRATLITSLASLCLLGVFLALAWIMVTSPDWDTNDAGPIGGGLIIGIMLLGNLALAAIALPAAGYVLNRRGRHSLFSLLLISGASLLVLWGTVAITMDAWFALVVVIGLMPIALLASVVWWRFAR